MDVLKGLLLAVRFGLELGALAALGYWGFKTGGGTFAEILLGIGAPAVAIVLWALFVSPKATFESGALRVVFEVVVFGAATAALWAADRTALAIAFGVIAAVDTILVHALDA